MIETLNNRLYELACSQPDKLAVAFKKETLSYAELFQKITRIARLLRQLGIEKGDRVMFSATSKPEMVATYLGVQFVGAIAVFIDKNATADNAYFIYKDTEAKAFFTDKSLKDHEEECASYSLKGLFADCDTVEPLELSDCNQPDPDDIAEMIYTSGTTGVPKGVMLSYKAVRQIWTNTIVGIGIRDDDRILIPLPLNHSFALRVLRAGLYCGATIVLQNGFTFAKEIENNLDLYHCTGIAIVPASVETISKQMQDNFIGIMSQFRYIEVSAGSLTLEQRYRLTKQLPDTLIFNTWGSSESGGALFLNVSEAVKDEKKALALGKPLPCVDVITLDENGNAFKSDSEHPGRMALRGDMQMSGYWNRPEITEETLRDGWLLTGDMIYEDEDGFVYMLGRADDIINVGGEKVSPVEVENIAGQYENIAECACIGVPDPDGILGFVPVLFVVPKNMKFDEDDLRKFLTQHMERYKVPVRYISMIELPRNKMQKIDRKALKLLWEKPDQENLMNEVIQTILTRRSIRKFTDQVIDKDILQMILNAGYYAPTGHNMQTWRFTVIRNPEEILRLKEAARETAEKNKVYFYGFENPNAIILVSNDERNPYSCQNASCAVENIMLAAWSYGIGSVWLNPLMTLRNKEPVKNILDSYGIPESHIIWSMVALGYPIVDGTLLKKNPDVIKWIE